MEREISRVETTRRLMMSPGARRRFYSDKRAWRRLPLLIYDGRSTEARRGAARGGCRPGRFARPERAGSRLREPGDAAIVPRD